MVLDVVKSRFPDTKEFIDNTLREVCEKEKKLLQMRQFFASLEAMHWLEKTFLF